MSARILAILLACLPLSANALSPNFLFIAVDDLRHWVNYSSDYQGTDIHGHSVHTPNIDALAARSTRYLNAYVTMPQCTPSRTSVMFGLSPASHGMTSPVFSSGPEYDVIYNDPDMTTIPEVLSAHGYYSASAGKVFNTQLTERWDESGPGIDFAALYTPFSPGPDGTYMYAELLPAVETHPDQHTADWGIDFIDSYASSVPGLARQPFFLALGFYQPHQPWRVPQSYYDLYPVDQVVAPALSPAAMQELPAPGAKNAHIPKLAAGVVKQFELIQAAGKAVDYTRAYLAAISHTDAMIGRVMAALAASRHASNTIVIFWSDNGYHLGEGYHWRKSTLWEPAVRVPLLISAPVNYKYPQDTDVTDAVSLLDIAATVVDLAGIGPVPQFEGAPLYDVARRSPVEIYLDNSKATVSAGVKHIDYDVFNPSSATRARYILPERHYLPPPGMPPGC